jgi:glycosyltransferase involved in cell wall biosynthesis
VRDMSLRLVIVTEIIAPYRIPVFNALAKQEGISLHVIFLAENDPALRQWLVYKDEIRFSYRILPSWRQRLGRCNVLLNWGLAKALRRASPGAILCGGYNYVAAWQSQLWARRHRLPFLLWVESTRRDLRGGHALVEFLKTRFMRRCDGFVVPGKSSFEYLMNYGTPEELIFTAPNAVDTEFFERRAEAARKDPAMRRQGLHLPSRYFLCVGRLVQEKGVFDLLQAYGTLTPELRATIGLVFVGDGVARSELQKRAAAITPGSVKFAGFAQREQLTSYYGLAEALVFPTHSDTWGLVVNEAMASGLPVISTSVAGCVADLVEDGWNGRVVPAADIGTLASAMDQLGRGAELGARMGEHSRERIRGYSPEACAAGIARAVLASGSGTP